MDNSLFLLVMAMTFIVSFTLVLIPVWRPLFEKSGKIRSGKLVSLEGEQGEAIKGAFIECIDACKKFIKMKAGECNIKAYNSDVGAALRRAAERGVEIEIICGPIMMIDNNGFSPILSLAKEGRLKLYFNRKREGFHYRVGDPGQHLYWEEPHALASPRKTYYEMDNNPFESELFIKDFNDLINRVKRSLHPEDDFIPVKVDELENLKTLALSKRGKKLEDMDAEEIRPLLREMKTA